LTNAIYEGTDKTGRTVDAGLSIDCGSGCETWTVRPGQFKRNQRRFFDTALVYAGFQRAGMNR